METKETENTFQSMFILQAHVSVFSGASIDPLNTNHIDLCSPAGAASCGQLLISRSSYTKQMDGLLPWVLGGEVGKKGESPWQVTDSSSG